MATDYQMERTSRRGRMAPSQLAANPRYTTDTLPSVLQSVVDGETPGAKTYDTLFDDIMQGPPPPPPKQSAQVPAFVGGHKLRRSQEHRRSAEEKPATTLLDIEGIAKVHPTKRDTPDALKVSSKPREEKFYDRNPFSVMEEDLEEVGSEKEMFPTEDKIELLRVLMNYFKVVDPHVSRYFVDSCLSMVESKGLKTVEKFLIDIYGSSPFDVPDESPPMKEGSTVQHRVDRKPEKKKKQLITIDFLKNKVKSILADEIMKSSTQKALESSLYHLLKFRHVLDKSFEREKGVEAIRVWTFRHGTEALVYKLEEFYLSKYEKCVLGNAEAAKFFPDVPYHSLHDKAIYEDNLRRVERADKKISRGLANNPQVAVIVDDKTSLDISEIAHLWVSLFKYYRANNYLKQVEIDLVRQTENSVYFVLQHGIVGFNKKLEQKYGERFATAKFILPEKEHGRDEALLAKVLQIYERANKSLKAAPKAERKKNTTRTFEKLIDALNFKFQSREKPDNETKKNVGVTGSVNRVGKFLSSIRLGVKKSKAKVEGNEQPDDGNETLFSKKIHLFLLQSMKTPPEKIPKEKERLVNYYKKHGFRALSTNLRIFYGGKFEEIDYMKEDEVSELLEQIQENLEVQKEKTEGDFIKRKKSETFNNIYNELSFQRNPEAKMRYNKN